MTKSNKKKTKYYAVYGTNGLGVYDDYSKVQRTTQYINKHRQKSFENKEEAKIYACRGYNSHQTMHKINEEFLDWDWQTNWIYYENDLAAFKVLDRVCEKVEEKNGIL